MKSEQTIQVRSGDDNSERAGDPDAGLMRRIEANDAAALETLYGRHARAAYSLALSIVREPTEAQEATQDAFLALWRTTGYRHDRGSVRAYLLAIVRNRSLDSLRRKGSRPQTTSAEPLNFMPANDDVAAAVESGDRSSKLRAALARLPEAQREALALAFWGGLSHTDIAARLGQPVGTVKGRIRLGVERLRDLVPPDYAEPPAAVAA